MGPVGPLRDDRRQLLGPQGGQRLLDLELPGPRALQAVDGPVLPAALAAATALPARTEGAQGDGGGGRFVNNLKPF